MRYYLDPLKKYAEFSGRATRMEFWLFCLFNLVISTAFGLIDSFAALDIGDGTGLLGSLYGLAVLIPSIAVHVRRLHDIGKSGWWSLIALVPIVGWVMLILFWARDSQPGPNQFGPNPKHSAEPVGTAR